MQFGDFFTFDKFVTPKLITFIYWIGLFFIVLSAVAIMFGGSLFSLFSTGYGPYGGYGGYGSSNFGVAAFVGGLLYGVILALCWRVLCEIWVVIFSINDRLGALVGLQKKDH